MITVLTLALLSGMCKNTVVINHTNDPWSTDDNAAYLRANAHCADLYPKSPCLAKFEKRKIRSYWATCGKSNLNLLNGTLGYVYY